ncbi:MAG: Fe(3+) ions import ATP-binding protein FbpC [Syntrophomonadaceae bacterium]|nr:Fe(3+) ions import ATP-binding protein FbpC [Bacillota bacterium]
MFDLDKVRYKNILSVNSLCIPAGKVTCIIGESGGGKTTLLRLLNKLISPDTGEIRFHGVPLPQINAVMLRRKAAMLSQEPVIFPGTVRENLLAGLRFSEKPPASDQALQDTLQLVCLEKQLTDQAEQLSGGEKQRLALGRLLLLDPEAFLLDEPSSALDEETEKLLLGTLYHHIRATGKTLVMVTHSKALALQYGNLVVVINNGRMCGLQEDACAGN